MITAPKRLMTFHFREKQLHLSLESGIIYSHIAENTSMSTTLFYHIIIVELDDWPFMLFHWSGRHSQIPFYTASYIGN